jgi:glycosyltransferase involved in cell wall biosynthesis
MKILHLTTATTWRGGEQQMAYLASCLALFGHEQLVLCPAGSAVEARMKELSIPCHTYTKRGNIDFAFARKLSRLASEEQVSLIHLHESRAHTLGFLSALLFGNKVPMVVHRRVAFPVSNNIFSKLKYNHSSVSRIICISDKVKEITAPSIRNKNKLVTIYSGVDLARFKDKLPTGILHREYDIEAKVKIIGNIAALTSEKDFYTFIDTAEILLSKRNDLVFMIIGDGPLSQDLQAYINERSLQGKVILTGRHNDVPDILPELSVLLVTSLAEGLNTTILDAFACKVPVVATETGGIPEIVHHRETGLLAAIKNSGMLAEMTSLLLEDVVLRKRLVENAFQNLSRFSVEEMALQTARLYEDVLKEAKA